MVRKLSLSAGPACAMTFSAAVFLCSCGRAPGAAVRKGWGALQPNGITSPVAMNAVLSPPGHPRFHGRTSTSAYGGPSGRVPTPAVP